MDTPTVVERLARLRGIGDAYWDYRGELRHFSLETKAAILAAMGCPIEDPGTLERATAELEFDPWRRLLPPVKVLREEHPFAVELHLREHEPQDSMRWRITFEGGGEQTGNVTRDRLPAIDRVQIEGTAYLRYVLELPPDLPTGYHRLDIATGQTTASTTLIVTPRRCFRPPKLAEGGRIWGLSAQLYTVRSDSNWGIGDFADLKDLVEAAAARGAGLVGLNPLHALTPANPEQCSPYSPSNRFFLNVMYIAVTEVPEFAECSAARERVAGHDFQTRLAAIRAVPDVDYSGVAAAKLPVLRLMYRHFLEQHLTQNTPRAEAFREFVSDQGHTIWVHAVYDALDEHFRSRNPQYWGWPSWPEPFRDPESAAVHEFSARHWEEVEFFLYLQWLADTQLASAQSTALENGMSVGLYGDIAVGVNGNGSESWANQRLYRREAAIGAPPDPLALKGQSWGIPPQDPHELREQAYRPFVDLLRDNMRHCGALRIDHVMALFRQWWVPAGHDATEGAYVHYPLADLMGILALESQRNECLVIGEDLGTVPDEMRAAMREYGVFHYKVLLFEKDGQGNFKLPDQYLHESLATVTTHDLPTLKGFWEGRDLKLRDRLNLFPSTELRHHVYDEREADRYALLRALATVGLFDAKLGSVDYSSALGEAIHAFLAQSHSAVMVAQLEDLIGMRDSVNVPGTSTEHANWQRKLSGTLESIFDRADINALLVELNRVRSTA